MSESTEEKDMKNMTAAESADAGMGAAEKSVDAGKDSAEKSVDTEANAAEEELAPIKTKREPLPTWGITSLFIPVSLVLTAAGVVLGHVSPMTNGIPKQHAFRYSYIGIGVILLIAGLMMFLKACSDCQLFLNLKAGRLITTGIYSLTRHPLYCSVLLGCTGILLISGNAFFYALPIGYYFLLVYFLKNFEEPFLVLRFGNDYIQYMTKVNRVFPLKKVQ